MHSHRSAARFQFLPVEEQAERGDAPPAAQLEREYGGFAGKGTVPSSGDWLAANAPMASNWVSLGPRNLVDEGFTSIYEPSMGRIACVAVDPGNSNKVYAGAASGGVWVSTDAGANWTPRTDKLPVIGVSDIKIDQRSTSTVYLATGDADSFATPSIGVYKSTDGGTTWNATALVFDATAFKRTFKLAVDPTISGKVYAATSDGIYITSDAGATWTLKKPQGAAGNYTFYDVKLKPGTPATVYAAATGGRFYRSTDSGNNWTQITTGLPAAGAAERSVIDVSAANSSYVYVLYSTSSGSLYGLYRSTDGGGTFAAVAASSTLSTAFGSQGYYSISMAVSPTNANDLYVGGVVPAHSADGGVNWTTVRGTETAGSYPIVHVDIHDIEFAGSAVYVCSDGGLHRTTDAGAHWANLSQDLVVAEIYRFANTDADPGLVYAGEQDNGVNRLLNGKWEHVAIGDYADVVIDPTNSSNVYASSYRRLYRSTDGGANFNALPTVTSEFPSFPGPPLAMDRRNTQVIFAGYQNIYRSADGGTTWTKTTSFTDGVGCKAIEVAPSDSSIVYAARPSAAAGNNIVRSADNGVTWAAVGAGLPANASVSGIAIDPANANRVWITLQGGAGSLVFRTENGGAAWSNISGSLPNLAAQAIVYEKGTSDGIFVGMSAGVYFRDASSTDWQPFSTNLPNAKITDLQINYTSRTLRAATYGRGVWETDLPNLAAPTSQLLNLSTRKQVGTGSNVLIGGFIVTGTDAKKVIVRGLGPSLPVAGALADPTLEIHRADTSLLAANDNWRSTQSAEITATGIPPSNDLESAIVATLPAAPAASGGAGYTAILAGNNGGTGTGLLEIYDLATGVNSKLANISTRGFVGMGDDLLIGGFIPGPTGRSNIRVLVRALGPSLANQGVAGALQDPVLELHDGNGATLATNDNWRQTQESEIIATGVPPSDNRESAMIATLPPSNSGYTAVVRGSGNTTGVALVEIYGLN